MMTRISIFTNIGNDFIHFNFKEETEVQLIRNYRKVDLPEYTLNRSVLQITKLSSAFQIPDFKIKAEKLNRWIKCLIKQGLSDINNLSKHLLEKHNMNSGDKAKNYNIE